MSVTWKDYKGPWLGKEHKKLDMKPGRTPDEIERSAQFGIQCCAEEKAAREEWATFRNVELGLEPYRETIGTASRTMVRVFDTGANRDKDDGKLDYEGFLSPLVLEAYASYMNFNRRLNDGSIRASDNWQKGIPLDVYAKSGWRHFFDWWKFHRGIGIQCTIVFAICGVLFNASGYLHEKLKADPGLLGRCLEVEEGYRKTRLAKASAASAGAST